MAHSNDLDYPIRRINEDNLRNFAIYDSDKKTVIQEYKNDELTTDQAAERLKQTLATLSGLVWVELCPMSKAQRGQGGGDAKKPNQWIALQCGGNNTAAVQGIGNVNQSQNIGALMGAMEEKFNARIEAIEEKNRLQREIDNLKRELEEAKEGSPTLAMLQPHLPRLIDGIFGNQPAAIAGTGNQPATVEEVSADEQARAEKALGILCGIDPDFINVLERLAYMAQTNLPNYNMAKNFLPQLP